MTKKTAEVPKNSVKNSNICVKYVIQIDRWTDRQTGHKEVYFLQSYSSCFSLRHTDIVYFLFPLLKQHAALQPCFLFVGGCASIRHELPATFTGRKHLGKSFHLVKVGETGALDQYRTKNRLMLLDQKASSLPLRQPILKNAERKKKRSLQAHHTPQIKVLLQKAKFVQSGLIN